LGAAAILLIVYLLLTMLVLPPDVFFMGDQGPKFLGVQSWAESGFTDGSIPYPGAVLDPEERFAPSNPDFLSPAFQHRNGRTYAKWTELFLLPNALLFALFGYRGLYLLSLLPAVGTALLSADVARRLDLSRPPLVALVTGLATPVLFYAIEFWEHSLAVFFATAGLALFVAAVQRGDTPRAWLLAGGLLMGLAPILRAELYFLPVALGLAAILLWRSPRRIWHHFSWMAAGFILPVGLYWLFNLYRSGTPDLVVTSETALFLPYERLTVMRMFIVPAGAKKWGLALGITLAAVGVQRWTRRFPWAHSPWLAPALIVGSAVAIVLIHLARGHVPSISLSDPFPLAFFGVVGLVGPHEGKKRVKTLLLLGVMGGLFLLLTALFARHWGGSGWGPRYTLVLYPILVLGAWYGLDHLRSHPRKDVLRYALGVGFGLLLVLSLVIQAAGVHRMWTFKQGFRSMIEVAMELEPHPLVTPIRWYPEMMAPVYHEVVMFGVTDSAHVEGLLELLEREGVDQLWWVTMADPEQHVDDVRDPHMLDRLLGTRLEEERRITVPLGDGVLEYVLFAIQGE
jgi:4-amino-4-deoxy-L-arabinose transferase-like glycosyltransferase